MQESNFVVQTAAGAMETFVARPDALAPPVILYMDVWGVREELFEIAREVAARGYCCLAPDFYYRQGRIRNAFRDTAGRMISVERLDEAQKQVVRTPLGKLTDAMVVADTAAIIEWLDANEVARSGPIGVFGYCMGGRHAFRAAAAFPARVRATASLHGTELVTEAPDSPHRAARSARGEIYCGYGELDRFASPAVIAAVREALSGGALIFGDQIHPGAHHGYALPDRDVHDAAATRRDWERIFAMFQRQLS